MAVAEEARHAQGTTRVLAVLDARMDEVYAAPYSYDGQAWHREGATLAFTYQGERLKDNVEELAGTFGADTLILPCDVSSDDQIRSVFTAVKEKFGRLDLLLHAVAFAPKEALEGDFLNTSREAFRVSHDVSAYSLIALAREITDCP